ncbi:MAG: fibrobacter succinogenes major paralogous domain-containing protein [Daejeonella sp.]
MKRKPVLPYTVKTVLTLSAALLMLMTISCKKDKTTKTSTPPAPVTDKDGNVYKTVKIGNQIWMAENLRTKHYRDGSEIFNGTDDADWQSAGNANPPKGAWCKNPQADEKVYGLLYNWHALNNPVANSNNPNKSLAPEGWHIPTGAEWNELYAYLGGDAAEAGNKMKEEDFDHWKYPGANVKGGNNISRFTGLPGGFRKASSFASFNLEGYWWAYSTDEFLSPPFRVLSFDKSTLGSSNGNQTAGFSVRCIKDVEDK